jgi:hypothetical protein
LELKISVDGIEGFQEILPKVWQFFGSPNDEMLNSVDR